MPIYQYQGLQILKILTKIWMCQVLKNSWKIQSIPKIISIEARKKNGYFSNNNNANELSTCHDMDDLIHMLGPLTEDAVMKTLQARFNEKKYFVSFNLSLGGQQ